MLIAELIRKKRDGEALSADELRGFVRGIDDDSVTDAQIAAFAMAVWFRGMSVAEQSALTLAMRDSGTVLRWPELDGPVLDKHSTGGVGDFVSLVLGPMIAAAGGYVPMISGRGLGHTGGTLDKLESIPGLDTRIGPSRLRSQVREIGLAIIGQTDDLVPADRRIYAVRDVTATVASAPLIVASILSKKLAEGLDALVMDIKVGNGAFMTSEEEARPLAEALCRVARESEVKCNAVLTDMSRPIAWSAGNALEVAEAVAFLSGDRRHPLMLEIVFELAAELLQLGSLEPDAGAARARLQSVLDSGAAAERFEAMVREQGGPADFMNRAVALLPAAPVVRPVPAGTAGRVHGMDLRALGLTVIQLGGGRRRAEDGIDPAVGLSGLCEPGDTMESDSALCCVHAADEAAYETAAGSVRAAIDIGPDDGPTPTAPVIRARIGVREGTGNE